MGFWECTHRETAVDLLGGLGEPRLPVQGLAELLDEEHLGSRAGHLVGSEELEALGEGLDAEVGDELGDGGAAVSLGHDVLEVAEADLAHDVLLLGGGGAAERGLGGAAGGAGGLGGGHGARGEDEGVEGEGGHFVTCAGECVLKRVSDRGEGDDGWRRSPRFVCHAQINLSHWLLARSMWRVFAFDPKYVALRDRIKIEFMVNNVLYLRMGDVSRR